MVNSIKAGIKKSGAGAPVYSIGFNYGLKRYFKYVITGTKVMLPRNILYKTSQNPAVRKVMMKALVKVLQRELRKHPVAGF